MTGKRSEHRSDIKPARQFWLPFHVKGELFASKAESSFPDRSMQLMEAVVERENLHVAFKQVVRNDGDPGIDGMTVKELPEYLKREWPRIRRQLLNGEYTPKPVKRVKIPKRGGGIRQLGIPTVVDRFIQQAVMQELHLDGFYPSHRSAGHSQTENGDCYPTTSSICIARLFYAKASTTEEPDAGKPHVRDCAGGAG